MTFSFDAEMREGTIVVCRRCEFEQWVEELELESRTFISKEEEMCQMRCKECGSVLGTMWHQKGVPEQNMTHNRFAELVSSLKEDIDNVMTDEQIEEFREEVENLENKLRT